ncbi:MAG: amidohydrolase family protein [Euryarchaeota archaeon]|nr:amidohydrolase family protein [Euryarchaeota archaeon]
MGAEPRYLYGDVFDGERFLEGYVGISEGKVVDSGRGPPPREPLVKGVVLPTFTNAHTHVGDMFLRGTSLPRDLKAAVAPPDGVKHVALRGARREDVERGIRGAVEEMETNGVGRFVDFREGGLDGLGMLERAAAGSKATRLALSRPCGMGFDPDEVDAILAASDGIAVSGMADYAPDVLSRLSRAARERRKIFALHVSEGEREDIDAALELRPTFLVHMAHADQSDLERVSAENVPVVLCPRSNAYFTKAPDLEAFVRSGLRLGLGTDNAMLNSLDVLEEARFASKLVRPANRRRLVQMSTAGPGKPLSRPGGDRPMDVGLSADFVVFAKTANDPLECLFGGRPTILVNTLLEEARWKNTNES